MHNSVDMAALIAAIRAYIRARQRENRHYSQAAFARQIGRSASSVSDILSGKTKHISADTLARILAVVGDDVLAYRLLHGYGLHDEPQTGEGVPMSAADLDVLRAAWRSDPERLARNTALVMRLSPARRARLLAYIEGWLAAENDQD